ncbi:hypothetical protein [Demequina flava]|uniref:hypothetical protein n=1 Tax=Demequina flava TaxID=1095025 RepID=UPI00128AF2F4|nr:hypothetical protein [Demequina flava]
MTSPTDLEQRTYFRTLDAALADFALGLGAVDRVREVTRDFDFEHVYIPASREYIALEALGQTKPVAFITELYIALHPADGESEWVELPGATRADSVVPTESSSQWNLDLPMGTHSDADLDPSGAYADTHAGAPAAATSGTMTATLAKPAAAAKKKAASPKKAEPVVPTCPSCFTNLPATGACDYCG